MYRDLIEKEILAYTPGTSREFPTFEGPFARESEPYALQIQKKGITHNTF